ncbi:MAG: stage V sporulation protein AC [Oscillospiraceae bacterium]|nr:stage V sporulation protein AC [Oscillospiraceae bacterium]
MQITPELYQDMQKQVLPQSNVKVNTLKAFLIGGSICTIGQLLLNGFLNLGFTQEIAAAWTSITLVLCSAVLTGFGLYERMARHGGAGTLVPITGFANAIASSAIEAKTEGYVLGIGTKIFTIAGPVILYGCTASVIYGIIYFIMQMIT